jgi:hypothetical protein
MAMIRERGEMWPRNDEAIKEIPGSSEGGQGIYILYDGSTPVYVGRGNIRQRIRKARASKRRGQCWDHFSWYIVRDEKREQELEALLLRMLPPFLRILNRQRGRLNGAKKHQAPRNMNADPIRHPKHLRLLLSAH